MAELNYNADRAGRLEQRVMRGDWDRALRNDYTEPKELPDSAACLVAECEIVPRDDYKTWRDVYIRGRRIGMVRVKIGGWSECRRGPDYEAVYCGDAATLNAKDNRYSLAVLRLREIVGV